MKKTLDKLWPALAESRLAVALFAGLFVAAVIFLSVPTQFTVRGTNGEEIAPATAMATSVAQVHPPLEPICDLSDRRYDGCEMWGDARTASGANNSVVYFIPPPPQLATAAAATWSIRSQSRKIVDVREVTVRSLDASSLHEAPRCTVRRGVQAVVFALGSLTSHYWHAFSDVLVPLFTTARFLMNIFRRQAVADDGALTHDRGWGWKLGWELTNCVNQSVPVSVPVRGFFGSVGNWEAVRTPYLLQSVGDP
ncbi:unnamed protein product [Miscanthus lutarioriparius]|uniref:Uncharacterized protein n=1 Tax=Miscanthus lutarioriparius TaxID=422564 RepID=A0A811PZV7_9POAL|nr:unnamed protein product [Miscanthus lutarioriparius]